ncbi:unnamed protein product [Gongylonema pulchrum]|uniref:Transmembrane protein n=1 Tax=Gongylonema pulchrum TaxID=637853 RepID=A0A183DB78_9BILA|nr:unnamed protein product [Gongylonema pulchrum]
MAADSQATALLGSTRFNLALIGFLGCVVIYALRSDVSFAIVCMVNSTAVDLLAGNTKSNVSKHTTCQIRDDPADTLNSKKDVSSEISSLEISMKNRVEKLKTQLEHKHKPEFLADEERKLSGIGSM